MSDTPHIVPRNVEEILVDEVHELCIYSVPMWAIDAVQFTVCLRYTNG
jgi:hypothetical protein